MSKDGFKQRVERSSLGSRRVTAARVLASKSAARRVIAASQTPARGVVVRAPEKSS